MGYGVCFHGYPVMEAAGEYFLGPGQWQNFQGQLAAVYLDAGNCGLLLTPHLLGVWLLSGQARSSSVLYLEVIASFFQTLQNSICTLLSPLTSSLALQ